MKLISHAAYMPTRVRGVFYGWWLVAISGVVSVMALVPISSAMPVWMVALESHFGWSRTKLSLAYSLNRVEGSFMGPIEGYLTDRMGSRRIIFVGLLVLGAGFIFFSGVRNLWMFYLAFLVITLGQGLAGTIPRLTMLNNWFSQRRAVAMGWASVGTQVGALLLVPAIAWAIQPDHPRLGWQTTALILGIFMLLAAFPISRLLRNRPEDYNLRPDGDPPLPGEATVTPKGVPNPAATGFTAPEALRTYAFWLISFGQGFGAMLASVIFTHLGLLMKDKGFDLQATAWVLAVHTAVTIGFQIVGGYVGDRIPKNVGLFFCSFLRAGAGVLLAFSSSLPHFYLFAVLFGIGFGASHPLIISIRGDYFGRASFGRILGLSSTPTSILLLIAAPFAGLMRDTRGTYTLALLTLAALNFVGALLYLMAKKPALPSPPRP